jgi:hypothetical protein
MQAEPDLRNAKPRYVVKPVNPRLTPTAWWKIVAQDVLVSDKYFGSKYQQGNECYSIH